MKFSVFQVSRQGGRDKNEDRMGYCYTREAALFMLADGLGGHPAGEVAATVALRSVASQFQRQAQPQLAHTGVFLADALLQAHRELRARALALGTTPSTRTTLVAAVIQAGAVTWAHCGDSRLYLVRDGLLTACTRDHSYLAQHQPHPLRAAAPARHQLSSCLGVAGQPVIDVTGPLALRQGDKLLLCSDGLWCHLNQEEIVDTLWRSTVSQAVPDLVDQALRRGGPRCDNVTALALEWELPSAYESSWGVSTEGLASGDFASTVQTTDSQGVTEDLDDAAIERSIAEINEAIRRSAARKN